MNSVCVVLAVALCFIGGQALECYKCKIGVGDVCITTKTTCADGEKCFSGLGKAGGFIDVMEKGCLVKDKCGTTKTITKLEAWYTMTKTCCDTDLCNSALGHPPISAVVLTLASLCSLLSITLLL